MHVVGVFVKHSFLVNIETRPRVGHHPGVIHVSSSDRLAGAGQPHFLSSTPGLRTVAAPCGP